MAIERGMNPKEEMLGATSPELVDVPATPDLTEGAQITEDGQGNACLLYKH